MFGEAAVARVGLAVGDDRARFFLQRLHAAAATARAKVGPGAGDQRWATAAANRALDSLSRCELADLVAAFGLGTVAFAGDDPGDPGDPARALLRQVLRDRLIDLLRIGVGRPPFWCWEAAGGGGAAPHPSGRRPRPD